MLDETRRAVTRSGYPFARIAIQAGLAHNSVYALFDDDANPTIKTLEKIHNALADMPNKNGKTCDGCKHYTADTDEGIVCMITGSEREPTGCAMREPDDDSP